MTFKLLLFRRIKNEQDKLLFRSYCNFVRCLTEIGLKKDYDLDNIYKRYMGFVYEHISKNDKEFGLEIESMLPLFSYLQHSQGGRGSFIEKIISLLNRDVTRNSKISDLPFIFSNLGKFKLLKIYDSEDIDKSTLKAINELRKQFKSNFDWVANKEDNITFDLLKFEKDTLKLSDIKNRVDSGGTSARGESWKKILDTIKLINENKIILQDKVTGTKYTFLDYLIKNGIKILNLSFSLIYNIDGTPATKESDRSNGFLSESMKRYKTILREIETHSNFKNIKKDKEKLTLSCDFKNNSKKIKMEVSGWYGVDIIKEFFTNSIKTWHDVENKIQLYDDIWLTLKTVMDDRKILIQKNKNLLIYFNEIYYNMDKEKIKNIIFKDNLDITEVKNFLKIYETKTNKITDNKKHIINAFLVFCLYKKSVGSL